MTRVAASAVPTDLLARAPRGGPRWTGLDVTVRREPLMRFQLDIDLDALPEPHEAELGRILRYWAGNLEHYALVPGTDETVRDSGYQDVGSWRITA